MTGLLFQPESVESLAVTVLLGAMLGYLLTVRGKSRATWWLIATFAGFTLFWLGSFIFSSLSPTVFTRAGVSKLAGVVFFFGTGLAAWSYLHFSYRFLENPFPREARGVLIVTSVLLALDLGYAAFVIFGIGQGDPLLYHDLLGLGVVVWATVVLARKWRHTARETASQKSHSATRAYRAYGLLNGLFVVFITMEVAQVAGALETGVWTGALMSIAFLGFFFGLAAVYLNHAPEPTSFQVKLIGLSLVTMLALLTAVSMVLYPENSVEAALVAPPEREALQFTPDGNGGYAVTTRPMRYNGNGLGEDLHMEDDAARVVTLGFAFPFSGRRWDSLYVSPNGAITFGGPIYRDGRVTYGSGVTHFFNDLPKIAPLYVDLDPSAGGGVYVKRSPDQAVISWHNVPQFGMNERETYVQLVLHESGTIDFVYDVVESPMQAGIRGLLPSDAAAEPGLASATTRLPARIARGGAWIENFGLIYRLNAHEEVKKLVWLVLGATLFVLVVFPFFFRSSLVKPMRRLLGGMRRVNEGKLDTKVPVGVRDEIGILTHNFNGMTASLKKADEELKAYAEDLEHRVEERTAALQRSLEELQAAQAQLVQQEKMASLGALTAGIAHEIKNPLNFINNFAALSSELVDELREDVLAWNEAEGTGEREALLKDLKLNAEKIHEHGRRADDIVKSMLLHSRGQSGERQETDLNALVEEYVNLAYHGMRAQHADFNVAIARDYGEYVGIAKVVPQELGRVFINLLNNAFYAVHERAVGLDGQYAPSVSVSTRAAGNAVEIRIEDNGPGIPAGVREKIFEPFFTTKAAGEGTGLGLSMSYDIITQGHGGMLTVENTEGEGTAFVITLLVEGTPARTAHAASTDNTEKTP